MLPDREQLHHVYLLTGDTAKWCTYLREYLTGQGIELEHNSDLIKLSYDFLSIGDAKEFHSTIIEKPSGEAKFYLVAFTNIGTEAQNYLLKTLEEPPAHTTIFLITGYKNTMLSTIRSRVIILGNEKSEAEEEGEILPQLDELLEQGKAERIERLRKLKKSKKFDELTKAEVQNYFDHIERYVAENCDVKQKQKILSELYKIKSYVRLTGASIKVLLEYAALLF